MGGHTQDAHSGTGRPDAAAPLPNRGWAALRGGRAPGRVQGGSTIGQPPMRALLWAWGRPRALGQNGLWLFSRQAWRNPSLGLCALPKPHFLPLECSTHLIGHFKDSVRSVCKVLSTGESTRHVGAVLLTLVIIDTVVPVLGAQGREADPEAEPPGVSLGPETWQA